MRRALVVGLCVLVLLSAAVAAALLKKDDSSPLPSEDQLRIHGFAVWPEDTLDEGMDACEEAESWRLDSVETVLRFAGDVLRYSEPYVTDAIADWGPATIRYSVETRGVKRQLPMLIDVRKYDRCWFVVGATPREGGWPATLSFVLTSGQPQLAIKSTGELTEVGYGSWERSILGGDQVLLDLPELDPTATGHVISLDCQQVPCEASAWTLGFVPEPATTEVAVMPLGPTRERGICRGRSFHSPLGELVNLYAMTVKKPIEDRKVGKVVIKRPRQLRHLGIEPLGGHWWSFTVDGVDLQARVVPLKRCWKMISIDDRDHEVLKSLHVAKDSFTFDLRWEEATSAYVSIGSRRGGDEWDLQRMPGPITVSGLVPRPLTESFYVGVELREGKRLVSQERFWYRAP